MSNKINHLICRTKYLSSRKLKKLFLKYNILDIN